jgi:hypothetical protein
MRAVQITRRLEQRAASAARDRLRASLVSGGFVSPGTDYEVAVDNSLADQSMAEDPRPLPAR